MVVAGGDAAFRIRFESESRAAVETGKAGFGLILAQGVVSAIFDARSVLGKTILGNTVAIGSADSI